MTFYIKYHFKKITVFLFFILLSCQLQEPTKNHGILFLENRSKQLEVNNTNQNDVKKVIGLPHSTSIDDENIWIYVERTLSKGKYHKLGRHTLKTNNVLVLYFDKYGILKEKKFYNKDDIAKITFSKNKTENELAKKSFVETFLQSIRQKMYGNR